MIKEHADLTENYSAIDGIAKQEVRVHDYEEGMRLVSRAQEPIRSDVLRIIKLDDVFFEEWYIQRREVTENLLKQYELFSSIPNLYDGGEPPLNPIMGSYTQIKNFIKYLNEGLDYLKRIKQIREEIKSE